MGFEMKTPHCVTHRKSEQCRVKCNDYLGVVLLLPPNYIDFARLPKTTASSQRETGSRSKTDAFRQRESFKPTNAERGSVGP